MSCVFYGAKRLSKPMQIRNHPQQKGIKAQHDEYRGAADILRAAQQTVRIRADVVGNILQPRV